MGKGIMPIKVLHLIASNFLGGPERQILGHAAAVSPQVELTIGGFVEGGRPNELLARARELGRRTFALHAPHAWSSGQVVSLRRYLVSSGTQILCAHGYRAIIIGLMATRLSECRVLAFPRGWTAENLKVRACYALAGCLMRFADRVVAVSEAQAGDLQKRFRLPGSKVTTVHNAMNAADHDPPLPLIGLRVEFGIPAEIPLVTCIGRLSPEKGQRYLLEAISQLRGPALLLVGDGPERARLASAISSLGLSGRAAITGWRKDVSRFLSEADLVVLPSLSEGLPNVLLEAAAAGRARVATAVGGVPEVLEDGVSGLLVPAADVTALREAIALCCSSPELRRRFGDAGRQLVEERFRFDSQARKLEALYCDVLRRWGDVSGAGSEQTEVSGTGGLFISVVVPVRNEQRYLAECLRSLLSQSYDPHGYEVIVVDGESDDETRSIAASLASAHPNLRIASNPRRIVSCGRNIGIKLARGDVIAFVEGHALVEPDFLATASDCLARTGALCLGRYVEQCIPGDGSVQQATGLFRKSRIGRNPHSRRFARSAEEFVDPLSVATVYRRSIFSRVGFFDETLTTNEDVEFNWRVSRAGIKAFYSPGLRYCLHARNTLTGFLRQIFRYGCGKALFVRKHPRAFRPAYALPTIGVAALVVSPLLNWPAGGLAALPTAAYLGLAAGAALAGADSEGRRHSGLRVVLSALMWLGFGAGFGYGLLGPKSMVGESSADAPRTRLGERAEAEK